MDNKGLEVLEMEKNPNFAVDSQVNGSEMADDFFDEDLVNLDFSGLDDNGSNKDLYQTVQSEPTQEITEAKTYDKVDESGVVTRYIDAPEIVEANPTVEKENIEVNNSIENDNDKNEKLDDSYVLSNFDVLFDSLYSDVVGANNLITDLIEKKSSLNKNEQLLEEFKEKFEKEKEDFRNFVDAQKKAIESEKEQASSYIESKRAHLHAEEQKFKEDSESKKNEISLLEQSLKLEREKFEAEKANFEEQKRIELEQLAAGKEKLARDTEDFESEKKLTNEQLENMRNGLQAEQEQFARYKELEQRKMDLEEKNLQTSCARFKELVAQFNSGFEQLPNDNK